MWSSNGGGRGTAAVLVAAAIWSAGLVGAAAVVRVYRSESVTTSARSSSAGAEPDVPPPVVRTSSATLVEVNGIGVLVPMAIPLLAVATVGAALRRRRVAAEPGAGALAWTVTGLLTACTVVAVLSVGIFLVPVAVLLVVACSRGPGVGAGRPSDHR